MRYFTRSIVAISIVTLSACGGGGGGGSGGNQQPPPPPPTDEAIGGIWEGTATTDLQPGVVFDVIGLITESGEARFVIDEGDGANFKSIGPLTVSGSNVSGSGRGYAPPGITFTNGQSTITGTFSGTVQGRDSLNATWTGETGETGTFDLLYNPIYERDSTLGLLTGAWISLDDFLNPDAAFDIDAAGAINGQDILGCLFAGQISLIDTSFNAYTLNVTVTNCGAANGDYAGLGALTDDVVQNDVFAFQGDNNIESLAGFLLRQ